jgi:hypothetical protein
MASVSLAQATTYEPKNNDKFQDFSVLASFNIMTWLGGQREYIPTMDKMNIYRLSWDETFLTYDITVGTQTYHLGSDFTYTGHVDYSWQGVTTWEVPYVWPEEYRVVKAVVDYTYDFSAVPGGLDGTIHMIAVFSSGGMFLNSLDSTGDFQNVQIKATVGTSPPNNGLVYYLVHDGIVSGWPE